MLQVTPEKLLQLLGEQLVEKRLNQEAAAEHIAQLEEQVRQLSGLLAQATATAPTAAQQTGESTP
jgi:hypothetical protein